MPVEINKDILEAMRSTEFFEQDHLAVAAAYCHRLGLVDLIDELIPSKKNAEMTPGEAVMAMVLDTLSGRSPLYRLQENMQDRDLEVLLGRAIPPEAFTDIRLGRTLDSVYEVGTQQVISELGVRAVKGFRLRADVGNYDTTSTSVWGDYRNCALDPRPSGPNITFGHSKDGQPGLKQFMIECLCVEGGVPILGRVRDGNSSDKTLNNELLTDIRAITKKHGIKEGAFVYVADSAAVTEENLKLASAHKFLSRLPFSYNECDRVVAEAVAEKNWTEVGVIAEEQDRKHRPVARYKVQEKTVELYGMHWRALVVHSSAHDKRRHNRIDRELVASRKTLEKAITQIPKEFQCRPDAERAVDSAKLHSGLHTVTVTIKEVTKLGPGRPSASKPANTRSVFVPKYSIQQRKKEIQRRRNEAGCFVLISNIPAEGEGAFSGVDLLRLYKEQNFVEQNFAFLKDPLVVNDLFLKTPRRIEALGMILIIALMVWRLMEVSMRRNIQSTNRDLPGWAKRHTRKPTSFMMSTKIARIKVIKIGSVRTFFRPLTEVHLAYLWALGLEPTIFLQTQRNRWPEKSPPTAIEK